MDLPSPWQLWMYLTNRYSFLQFLSHVVYAGHTIAQISSWDTAAFLLVCKRQLWRQFMISKIDQFEIETIRCIRSVLWYFMSFTPLDSLVLDSCYHMFSSWLHVIYRRNHRNKSISSLWLKYSQFLSMWDSKLISFRAARWRDTWILILRRGSEGSN